MATDSEVEKGQATQTLLTKKDNTIQLLKKEVEYSCQSAHSGFIDYRVGKGKRNIEWWVEWVQRKNYKVCWREERMGKGKSTFDWKWESI